MQSGPSQVNQIDSPNSNPAAPITSSHHGRPLDQPDRIRDPRVEDHRGRSRHSSGSADASDLPRTSTVDPFAVNDGVRQLDFVTGGSKNSSRGSLDSIVAYNDSLPPTLHRPVSELPSIVVGNLPSRLPDNGTSSMADLPNEVLTHILSHLPPDSLSTVARVSRRFHNLVTTPHAWRVAFARYFAGPDVLGRLGESRKLAPSQTSSDGETLRSEKRMFTRLTDQASWRSEYILRTRLLRSLARGKPASSSQPSHASPISRPGSNHNALAAVTYSTPLSTTINHLHATFGDGHSKRLPRFIHGTDFVGAVGTTDPTAGKVDNWGASDPQSFLQFVDRFPGDGLWGLGSGEVIGVPNTMDLSQLYGAVYGEGSPGGLIYFRSVDELRGRFLASSIAASDHELGIPGIFGGSESFCSVWIAKSPEVLATSGGLVGILSGSSLGIVTAYSMGTDGLRDQRLGVGEITARWVLSPGVPIIAIRVDDGFNESRRRQNRIWAVALNALGELFYLQGMPKRQPVDKGIKPDELGLDRLAWQTGRSVHWSMVELTRRKTRIDPFGDLEIDGLVPPRSSWDGMMSRKQELIAESQALEKHMTFKAHHYRRTCLGWDMRRRLEVDFGGDDGCGGGENMVVVNCGLDDETTAGLNRYTRCCDPGLPTIETTLERSCDGPNSPTFEPFRSTFSAASPRTQSVVSEGRRQASKTTVCRWYCTSLSLAGHEKEMITTAAIDSSRFALLTSSEDPLLCTTSTSSSTLVEEAPFAPDLPLLPYQIPGDRARLMAVGTKAGMVIVWNMRGPLAAAAELVNVLVPLRLIQTDSIQISSLALTALYLVHGGNDGLVQAWDLLASTASPIRTLNSRLSSRVRRGLVQTEAGVQAGDLAILNAHDIGRNLFVAGAICLDPDPTVLRGVVSLGTHIRYWSYSSSATPYHASRKRRLRRSERGSNSHSGNFSATDRSTLDAYIMTEKLELEREEQRRSKEAKYLAGRFGVGLLGYGASEDETLSYARMLSEETFALDAQRRRSESDHSSVCWSSTTVTPEGSVALGGLSSPSLAHRHANRQEDDNDLAQAIRLSLQLPSGDSHNDRSARGLGEISIRYVKSKRSPSSSPPRAGPMTTNKQDHDLVFALNLSLAEQQSREAVQHEDMEAFPSLTQSVSTPPKGKGKRRVS